MYREEKPEDILDSFVFLDCKRCKKQLPLFAALGELKAFCPCSGTLHILIKYKDEKDDFEVDEED